MCERKKGNDLHITISSCITDVRSKYLVIYDPTMMMI